MATIQLSLTATRRGALAPQRPTHHSPLTTHRRRRQPRGVILLVAMAMLALFSVIVLTFVLVARQHKSAAEATLRSKDYDANYEDQLNQAALQILRGSNNPLSVLRQHSLFEDLYGDWLKTDLTANASYVTNSNNNLLSLQVTGAAAYNNYYSGQVLTMLEGDARNLTTRIVRYSYNSVSTVGTLWVLPFENGTLPQDGDELLINGRAFSGMGFGYDSSTFSPNGPSDTPAGDNGLLDYADTALTVGGTTAQYALMPNPVFFNGTGDAAGSGGANEDYDIADFNNLLVAGRYWNGSASRWEVALPSLHRTDLIKYWNVRGMTNADMRRVFLRPNPEDHANFTGSSSKSAPDWRNPDVNNNGVLDPSEMVWDVDNDGDGLTDSVWVDLGFPVQTARDGKQYKPLFAVLCIDLDGRLNVNAHGTAAHISQPTTQLTDPRMPSPGMATLPFGQGHGVAEVYLKQAFPTDYQDLLEGNAAIYEEGKFGEISQTPQAGWRTQEDFWAGIKTSEEFWNAIRTATDPTSFGSPADFDGDGRMFLDQRGQPIFDKMGEFASNETIDDAYEIDLSGKGQKYTRFTGPVRYRRGDNPFMPADLEPILRRYDVDYNALPSRLAALSPNDLFPSSMTPLARLRQGIITSESWDLPSPNIVPSLEHQRLLKHPSAGGTATEPTKLSVLDLWRMRMVEAGFTGNLNTEIGVQIAPELLRGLRIDLNRPIGNGRDDNGNGLVDEPYEHMWNDVNGNNTPDNGDDYERVWAMQGDTTTTFNSFLANYREVGADLTSDGKLDDYDSLARWHLARNLYVLAMTLTNSGYVLPVTGSLTLTSPGHQKELAARRLAQWAVNVVDFRDSDLIMTPFEYDANPFNGWDVDGFIGRIPGPDGIFGTDDDDGADNMVGTSDDLMSPDDTSTDRRLVWGTEDPVLLLTETLALHDRRVGDTPVGGLRREDPAMATLYEDGENQAGAAGSMGVGGYDQVRIPQGSAFIELYCTARNPGSNPSPDSIALSPDLFTSAGNLDVGRMVAGNPVWRLAFTMVGKTDHATPDAQNGVQSRLNADPQTFSLEPDSLPFLLAPTDPLQTPTPAPEIERIVWLSKTGPAMGHPDFNRVFWNRRDSQSAAGAEVPLPPGSYAVIGPYREDSGGNSMETIIGRGPGADGTYGNGDDPGGHERIQTTPVNVITTPASYPGGIQTGTAQTGIAVAATKTGWTPGPIGFSVSEPLFSAGGYYTAPTGSTTEAGKTVVDAYSPAVDLPMDEDNPELGGATKDFLKTGTIRDYKTVFLQRLANPTIGWNPLPGDPDHNAGLPVNPYITVDWLPIDLTVFNSVATTDTPTQPLDDNVATTYEANDPRDPDRGLRNTNVNDAVRFGSRERGTPRTPTGQNKNLWAAVSTEADQTPIPMTISPAPFFGSWASLANDQTTTPGYIDTTQTLGYINHAFHEPPPGTNPPWYTAMPSGSYDGAPKQPYSWLTWLNRPFTSNLELLQVPVSGPARLTHEYSASSANSPYTVGGTQPYGHLLNFFEAGDIANVDAPDYHKLLEYVTVPSRFTGTEDFLDPSFFKAELGTTTLAGLYAPFNRVSRFRDPGRININTSLDDGTTLAAILNNMQALDTSWSSSGLEGKILESRKGYGNNTDLWEFNHQPGPDMMLGTSDDVPGSPTFFANPFRSFGASYNVPLEALRRQGATATGTERQFVETSILRPDPDTASRPLFAFESTNDYNTTDNNPYFRYQALQKLGNVVTTRSNVYAVWITVGFFEVTPATTAEIATGAYPDGYKLDAEIGSDDGAIKRHRMFMMVDRSIPVAFERGSNHNVHKAILLKRVIE